MSATALVTGRLWRDPERRVSKAGKTFVSATIKDGDGDGTTWWTVLSFSESASDELLSLKAGDGVAVSGSFKVEIYSKSGEQRLSHTLFADRAISARRVKRERVTEQRRVGQGAADTPSSLPSPDDEIPF